MAPWGLPVEMRKMNKLVVMAVALTMMMSGWTALAADAAAKEPTVTVTGKVDVKDNAGAKTVTLTVTEAKGEDGNPIPNTKGAVLNVEGPKTADVGKLAGKTVEAKGTVKGGRSIEVTSVKAK